MRRKNVACKNADVDRRDALFPQSMTNTDTTIQDCLKRVKSFKKQDASWFALQL